MSGLQAVAVALNSVMAEDSSFVAFLRSDGSVSVYRKPTEGRCALGALLGVGRWENGTILGSNINCGILVRLEGSLRAQTGAK